MVLGGAGWDRKESSESNLHMCGEDDTKIVIYNMKRRTESKRTLVQLDIKTKPYDTSWKNSSEDRFLMVIVPNRLETLNLIVFPLG